MTAQLCRTQPVSDHSVLQSASRAGMRWLVPTLRGPGERGAKVAFLLVMSVVVMGSAMAVSATTTTTDTSSSTARVASETSTTNWDMADVFVSAIGTLVSVVVSVAVCVYQVSEGRRLAARAQASAAGAAQSASDAKSALATTVRMSEFAELRLKSRRIQDSLRDGHWKTAATHCTDFRDFVAHFSSSWSGEHRADVDKILSLVIQLDDELQRIKAAGIKDKALLAECSSLGTQINTAIAQLVGTFENNARGVR